MTKEQENLLSAPFEDYEIEWRVGATNKKSQEKTTGDIKARPTKGVMLAYITSRAIMDRLDTVVGVDNWKDEYREHHNGTICRLSVRFSEQDDWISKEDGADVTDIEPTKGGISDSLKRAAVKFGIGRYLYNAETKWVDLNEYGQPKDTPKLTIKERPISLGEALTIVSSSKTLDELIINFKSLSATMRKDNEVIAKCAEIKKDLTK